METTALISVLSSQRHAIAVSFERTSLWLSLQFAWSQGFSTIYATARPRNAHALRRTSMEGGAAPAAMPYRRDVPRRRYPRPYRGATPVDSLAKHVRRRRQI